MLSEGIIDASSVAAAPGVTRRSGEASSISPPQGSRAALDPLHHIDHLGPRGMAGGKAGAPGRAGDAPADRARGLVELDARGRRLHAERVPLHQVTFTGW